MFVLLSHILPKQKVLLSIFLVIFLLLGCVQEEKELYPVLTQTGTIPKSTNTLSPSSTVTNTVAPKSYNNLVFYGDSSLAIGEVGDGIEHVGYSFVSYLDELVSLPYNFIMANYGGRTAKWAYEHLDDKISPLEPDVLTLWFGMDDLGGCPGSFDRETNQLVDYKINTIVNDHIKNLSGIIDSSLAEDIPVIILTPLPILPGKLLWSHLDDDFNIVWEEGRWCDFILAEEILAQAQRELVLEYSSSGNNVYLVDVWQIYLDNPDLEKMYMDVVHPGSVGAQLIAEEWARIFKELSE